MSDKKLAVVTGASTGIGLELARCCAEDGYDLVICADEPAIETAAQELRRTGAHVEAVQADLATEAGVDALWARVQGRGVDALLANAGRGLGGTFLEQDLDDAKRVVALNVTGTIALIHKIGREMAARGSGRILITGSIAGFMPGSHHAVYNATKAFIDSFSVALRNELKDGGVTVTCLMPGPTDTEFFDRADLEDSKIGQSQSKDDPAKVARQGYKAMLDGDSGVVTGFMNKVQTAFAGLIPDTLMAEMHRRMAQREH